LVLISISGLTSVPPLSISLPPVEGVLLFEEDEFESFEPPPPHPARIKEKAKKIFNSIIPHNQHSL
jgi:hypothetical protein